MMRTYFTMVRTFLRVMVPGLVLLLVVGHVAAQEVFQGPEVAIPQTAIMPEVTQYSVYELDLKALHTYVKTHPGRSDITLVLGDKVFPMTLFPQPIRKANARVILSTAAGEQVLPARPSYTFAGEMQTPAGGMVRVLIDEDFFSGGFVADGVEYMIEPLWYYVPNAPKNQIILYKASLAQTVGTVGCGTDESLNKTSEGDKAPLFPDAEGSIELACKQVEYGAAADWSFYNKYGGAGGAQNRIDVIMNLVAGLYNNGQLQHTYEFDIVEYWLSDCSSCDPWSTSNDAGTLLGSFRSWGNSGGFTEDNDVAGLWTNRDFAGSTIGIAYISGLCNSWGYHCLQDWTSNTTLMSVMVAHELGHNFSCEHDANGAPYIMAPAVNNTSTWSSASVSDINAYTNGNSGNCLTACVPQAAPVANFTADETAGCAPLTVNFMDNSTNNPDSWYWEFPGGSPSFSTLQNPTVTYPSKGDYTVTLEASNLAGSDQITKADYISVNDIPVPYFEAIVDEDFVSFFNQTDGGTSYYWDFGDFAYSTEENPTHTYAEDGVYLVVLTATNECGTAEYSEYLTIVTPPIPEFSSDETEGCAPLTIHFLDLSTPNTTSWHWTFPGGTPASSTDQNPTVIYQNKGKFSVTLQASNAAGSNSVTLVDYIVVDDKPTGTFSYVLHQPDTVAFTNQTSNWTSLQWDFGDGEGSGDEHPVHVYAMEGDYVVTLTVGNDCGDVVIQQVVTITAPPTADFFGSPQTGCTPFVVQFTENASENATSFAWTFPGGNPATSTDPNPVVTYTTPGNYAVTLIASNPAGADTAVYTNFVHAITVPTAAFTSVGEGLVKFTNTSLYGVSFHWDFGDGASSNEENPSHQYQAEGKYTVVLTVTNDCGTDQFTQEVIITLPLMAGFTSNITVGCAPMQVQFQSTSSPNTTGWTWSFPGGTPSSSTAENPLVTYANAGQYQVRLVVSGASGTDTLTQVNYIEVGEAPQALYTSELFVDSVAFQSLSVQAQGYTWNFGDGTTSNLENPVHHYQTEGLYHVTLLVANECGVSTYCQPIQVVFNPIANFSSAIREACASTMTVDFEDLSSQTPDTWLWSFEGGQPATSTAQNPSVTYLNPGIFDVQLIASGQGWTDTMMLTEYIRLFDADPTAEFSYEADGKDVQFTNETVFGTCYQWEFPSGPPVLEVDPAYSFPAFGEYPVILIASNACGSDTIVKNVMVSGSAIHLPDALTELRIMPNPSNGSFVLELTGKPAGLTRYEIYDLLGRQVQVGTFDFGVSPYRLPVTLASAPSGQYLLRLTVDGQPVAVRFQIAD